MKLGVSTSILAVHRKAVQILWKIGVKGGVVYLCFYVHKSKISEVQFMRHSSYCWFNLNVEDNLEDYLSSNIHFSKSGNKAWLGQPYLIANSNQKFGKSLMKPQVWKMSITPGYGVSRPMHEDQNISKAEMSLHWLA